MNIETQLPWLRMSVIIFVLVFLMTFIMAKQYIEAKDFDIVGHYNDNSIIIYKNEDSNFHGKFVLSDRKEFSIRELLKDVLYIFYFPEGKILNAALTTRGGNARIWFENGTYWKRDKSFIEEILYHLNIFNWLK